MSDKRDTFSENKDVRELLDENISLNRKNRLLWVGLIGLAALSIFSINSCSKKADALAQTHLVMKGFRWKIANLATENSQLKDYAAEAQGFAMGIRPWYDENDSGCENTNCVACQQMEKENEQKFVAFTNALDTLNINPKMLERLQKGFGE